MFFSFLIHSCLVLIVVKIVVSMSHVETVNWNRFKKASITFSAALLGVDQILHLGNWRVIRPLQGL